MTTNENLPAQVPNGLPAVPANGGGWAALLAGLPHTAQALAQAQRKVRRVAHDARNAYHQYPYTSSEAIIESAKDALADHGLAILPVEQTLDGWEREGENRFQLVCRFLLIHESGEAAPLLRHWPVCPDRGRPLDKATAAASTLALHYLLRDLLLIPRTDPAVEVAAREDRPVRAAAAAPPAADPGRHRMLLRQCHLALAAAGKTWDKALGWAVKRGFLAALPDAWEAPAAGAEGIPAAVAMASWVPERAVVAILKTLPEQAAAGAPGPN